MDYEACNSYFDKVNKYWFSFIFFGAMGALVGIIMLFSTGWGWLFLIVGVLAIFCGFGCRDGFNKLTDAEYDKMVADYVNANLEKWALKKFGINESDVSRINPIFLGGYCFDGNIMTKVGLDRIGRSNKYKAAILLFSQQELYCYVVTFYTTSGDYRSDSAQVYFYKDIVTVSTKTETINFKYDGADYHLSQDMLEIVTSGGTGLSVSMSAASENVNNSINQMRSLINGSK